MYIVKVINIFINLPCRCVCFTGVMTMIKINFKVYNTGLLLTIVTRLYIRFPDCYELFYLLSYRTFRTMVLKKAAQELDNSLILEIRDDLY